MNMHTFVRELEPYMVYKKDIKFLTLNGLFPQLNSEFQKGFKKD